MNAEMNDRSLLDTAVGLWRRRKWLFLVSFLVVFAMAVGLVAGLPSLYRASTTIVFSQDDMAESMIRPDREQELELRLAAIRKVVLSREQLQEVIREFDLYPELRAEAPPESVVRRLREDIAIEQQSSAEPRWRETSSIIVTISFQYWEPEKTAEVANEIAARFRAENTRMLSEQTARASGFLGQQLDEAKARLDEQEARMNAFKSAHASELPEQQYFNISTLERLNDELRRVAEKRNDLLRMRYGLPLNAEAVETTPYSAGLAGSLRLERLQRELKSAQLSYTDAHPRVIRLKQEIEDLEAALAANPQTAQGAPLASQDGGYTLATDPDLADLRRQEAALRAEVAEVTRRIEATPGVGQQLEKLALDYEAAKQAYLSLRELFRNAQLAESLQSGQSQQFRVIEAAIPSDIPVAPNTMMLALAGLVLALGIAGGLALLVEQFDRSFHSVADLRRFTGVPVLASIAEIPTAGTAWRRGLRFTTAAIVVLVAVVVVAGVSNQFGESAQHLVWRVAN